MNLLNKLVYLIIFLVLVSCSPTKTTVSWKKPDYHEPHFQKIAVIGLVGNLTARQNLEQETAQELVQKGMSATASMNFLPPNTQGKSSNIERLTRLLKAKGFDAVLTVSLDDIDKERHYVPGRTTYHPHTRYHRFGNYYTTSYHRVRRPGYFTSSATFYIESNLYDLDSQELVWMTQAKTTDPNSLKSASKSYAKNLTNEMKKEGII
ncbi:MAG: hypothetical protein ACR2MX_00715 [Cyclobacteriaceae bacterium]